VKDSAFTGAAPPSRHSSNGARPDLAGDGPSGCPGRAGRPDGSWAPPGAARGRRRAARHCAGGHRRGRVFHPHSRHRGPARPYRLGHCGLHGPASWLPANDSAASSTHQLRAAESRPPTASHAAW